MFNIIRNKILFYYNIRSEILTSNFAEVEKIYKIKKYSITVDKIDRQSRVELRLHKRMLEFFYINFN